MAVIAATFTFNARISSLAQTLCEQRPVKLPAEDTDLIACHFGKQHLLSISLLSSKLHVQANAIIYHDVALDFESAEATNVSRSEAGVLFLRSLVTSQVAAYNVQRLSFTGSPLSQWRKENRPAGFREKVYRTLFPPASPLGLSTWTPHEIKVYEEELDDILAVTERLPDEWYFSLSKLCLGAIVLVTRLQHLQINSDYLRYSDFRDGLRGIIKRGALQSLETLDLCTDLIHGHDRYIDAVRGWDATLLAPFSAPVIKSIKVAMVLQSGLTSQLRTSSLTCLILRHYQEGGTYSLDTLLSATPHLRYLEYHAWVEYGLYHSSKQIDMENPLGLEPLFNALQHVRGSLECLVASMRVIEDDSHWDWGLVPLFDRPFRLSEELFNLRCLTKLSIPFASLLGWQRKEGKKWDWGKLLPASLRDITWTDHLTELFDDFDDWSDHSLLPVISSLLEWLSERPSGNEELQFKLYLPRSDSEFNEPVRKEIYQLCEKHGVRCVIEKRYRDLVPNNSDPQARSQGRGWI